MYATSHVTTFRHTRNAPPRKYLQQKEKGLPVKGRYLRQSHGHPVTFSQHPASQNQQAVTHPSKTETVNTWIRIELRCWMGTGLLFRSSYGKRPRRKRAMEAITRQEVADETHTRNEGRCGILIGWQGFVTCWTPGGEKGHCPISAWWY